MTFTLFGGRKLLLAGSQLGWFWIATGLVAIVLLLVLYREERRLVSRAVGLGLLSLRILAALVLVTTLFEPIAARTFREVVRGRVLLAVDVSESMATTDPGRSGEERAALLKTLGMNPNESLDSLTRRELARHLIVGKKAPLASIGVDHSVEAYTFARDCTPATLATLGEVLQTPAPADEGSQATDWVSVLSEALKSSDAKAPVLGVVLVTDGRRNAPGDVAPTVDRLAAQGIPVYSVLVGSTKAPRDAAVASVKAPEAVYKGDVATVEATLKLDGYAGQEVAVTLDRPGVPQQRQKLRARADGTRPIVSFRSPMELVGNTPLTVKIEPLEGDMRPDNDHRTVLVQVADDKAKVLIVDGEARWEFRYLRNALARDPRVSVEAVVFHQPHVGITEEKVFTYGTSLPVREGTNPDPLHAFDVMIVGDIDPSDMTAEFWERLERFVSERGGTLVFCPGTRHWRALAANEIARKLMPVLEPKPIDVDPRNDAPTHPALPAGVPFVPESSVIADANAWPMLQFASEAEESRRRWLALPRLPWVLAGKGKPGATALALAGDDPTAVLMGTQPYGLGKTLWVGTDGTWRWRFRVGDAYHHRFWGQVVRWANAGKLAAGNAFVRFGPLKPRADDGVPIRIQARISEGVEGVRSDLLIAARIFKAGLNLGKAVAVVPLRLGGQPRTFEGVAPNLPIGSYVVRLDVPGLIDALQLQPAAPVAAPEAGLEVVARDSSERVELSASRDALDQLASATGGRVILESEVSQLPLLLRAKTKETVRTEETPLWDSPAALIIFFVIVTVEWVARKRVGLP